jgi:hypothetical protein
MSFKTVFRYLASDTDDAIDKLKDTLVSAGWTLYDDLSSSGDGYVMTTTGEDSTERTAYLHFYSSGSDYISFLIYAYWSTSTHSGTYYVGSNSSTILATDDDGSFYIWISADLNDFFIVSYLTYYNGLHFGLLNPFDDTRGEVQTALTSGSDITIQLGSGEAEGFKVGREYQMVGDDYRENPEVTAVDTTNDQITVDSLAYIHDAGSMIGTTPVRWFLMRTYNHWTFTFTRYHTGSSNSGSSQTVQYEMLNRGYVDPCERTQRYYLWPLIYNGYSSSGVDGYTRSDSKYMKAYIDSASEHTMSVNDHDTGTSSGSNDSTTLNDTSKSWSTDEWAGKVLIVSDGTGSPYYGTISSNTSTALTVSPAFTTLPDDTSEYTICDEGWMFFYFYNGANYAGAMRCI